MTNVGGKDGLQPGSPEAREEVRLHREYVARLQEADAREADAVPDALARIEFSLQRVEALLQEKERPRRAPRSFLYRRRA